MGGPEVATTAPDRTSTAGETGEGDADDRQLLERLKVGWFGAGPVSSYWLTRFFILRGLGLIYFVAFFSIIRQAPGLIGSHGILPARWFLNEVHADYGSLSFWKIPTLFWFGVSDRALLGFGWLGVALSVALLAGVANAPLCAALWFLYLSFVHVGQVFWGYGWELLLLELGFLAIFLSPALSPRPLPRSPPPVVVIWLMRWLAFRLMFGAGLIKLRGDPCWTDLTCMYFHYETQPNPNPLSFWFHHFPPFVHRAAVLFNHFVELIAPWGVFGPRRVRHVAGGFLVVFQVILILSGNLSFLNWLTIVVCLSCFDDSLFERLFPRRLRARIRERLHRAGEAAEETQARLWVVRALAVIVALLSLNPLVNMLSPRQAMNASFDPFSLVNTYGAFGSVSRERYEVVLEGTSDDPQDPNARWLEYEFFCKPGDPRRRPCWISPYHYRLDWQMWFAGLGTYRQQPWILRLIYKLLEGDDAVEALLAKDPFPARPPRAIRAGYYRYRFSDDLSRGYWQRERVDEYLPALSLDDPRLLDTLDRLGWLKPE